MQILPPVQSSTSALPGSTSAPDRNPAAVARTPAGAPPVRQAQEENLAAEESAAVEISGGSRLAEARASQVPVYAEIWKGPVKLAQIDIHGHVVSFSGLIPSGGGGLLAGPLLAAQRAVQVAQQTGGEIRAAGQALDGQTLLMRARLEKAYAP